MSSFSFRVKKKKIKIIKKYFKDKKGEVINAKSGHQIRASVKISVVILDPISLFFFSSHQTFCPTTHYGVVFSNAWRTCSCQCCHSCSGVSSVLTFMTSPPAYCTNQRSPETQTDKDGPAQLEGGKKKQSESLWTRLDCPQGEGILTFFTQHSRDQIWFLFYRRQSFNVRPTWKNLQG